MRKVALLGLAGSCNLEAPFDDPDWEFWCLAWDLPPRGDRYFEPHRNWRELVGSYSICGQGPVAWMKEHIAPVYFLDDEPDIPMARKYPLDAVRSDIFPEFSDTKFEVYCESSIAWMVALAIHEKVDRIGIWGVDLNSSSEYVYQRPNMEYLIGLARGRGIRVTIPPESSLCKTSFNADGCYMNGGAHALDQLGTS